jgi:dimethylsulfide dehydrogenase subunit alpha/complex iron-sulfur molybdoenzyme family reductase subunit alpha
MGRVVERPKAACRKINMDRRQFLKAAGICSLGLGLPKNAMSDALEKYAGEDYVSDRSWEELFRREFNAVSGDSTGYAFHCSNCQGNCAWKIHSRNGMILREEQLAQYPQTNRHIPDANPRGCNKGAIHSQAMYEKDRIKYPLKRTGKRGSGKWKRISWDKAITEISEKIVDTLMQHGPGSLMFYAGTGLLSQGRRAGPLRLGSLLGSIRLYPSSAVGDMFTGASLAYGIPNIGHSLDAWFEMDYILLWGINPNVTRIPDAHYLWEGRYNGAKIVTISPEYSPTAMHSDLWVPINPGSDSFLAMSMINVVFREKLYKESFIKEQTDLPFLVRLDNKKLLRESDLKDGGRDEIFFFWDLKKGKIAEAPGARGSFKDTLRLKAIQPSLEGDFEVKGKNGESIPVTTVFEMVRAEAGRFSPEKTAKYTGINPDIVYKITREFARAEKADITIGFSLHKYAWGVLACWAQALLCAMTGHAADTGGLDTEHQWSLGGIGPLSSPKPARFESGFLAEWMSGEMWETFRKHYRDDEFRKQAGLGIEDLIHLAQKSVKEKWLVNYGSPKVMVLFADNMFRRNKSSGHYKQKVLDKTELYVNVNFRMDSSAELADYVLPAQSHYEGWDIRGELGYHRFVNMVVPPPNLKSVGEAKGEWEICRLLTEKIEEMAKTRGITALTDSGFVVKREDKDEPVTRNLDTLHSDFTMGGKVQTDKDVVKWLLENVPAFKPWRFEDAVEHGFIVLNNNAGFTSPLYNDKPYHSFEDQVYLKKPYPTLSGRQQFYIDQEVFLKLNATVPTARAPVYTARFPLKFYSPHTRWGIHSTWRTNKYMLRLQRGEPHVSMSPADAKKRKIKDGGRVRIFNDIGEFYALAKVSPNVRAGTLMMDHAWEPHQFKYKKGMDEPVAGLLSPIELAGGWGHLKFGPEWDGNQLAYESSVQVEKA